MKIGEKAPQFILPKAGGGEFNLEKDKGKWTVIYFYPKDHTPGCTVEACDFRDFHGDFLKKGVVVVGVSDVDKKMLENYGVWQEKSMMGRKYMGIVRTTILLDSEGRIVKIWDKVKVGNHVREVLSLLSQMTNLKNN